MVNNIAFILPAYTSNDTAKTNYVTMLFSEGVTDLDGNDLPALLVIPNTRRHGRIPKRILQKFVLDDIDTYFPECGKRQYTANELEDLTGGALYDVTFGVRNPAANNYGIHYSLGNEEEPATPINHSEEENFGIGHIFSPITPEDLSGQIGVDLEGYLNGFNATRPIRAVTLPAGFREPVYQIADRVTFDFDNNPTKDGVTDGDWRWNGNTATWESTSPDGPSYRYTVHASTTAILSPDVAGEWQTLTAEIPVPDDWILNAS